LDSLPPAAMALWALVGLFAGALGTMIGAGGGLVLVPLMLLLFPTLSPAVVTSVSLTTVMFNCASGSVAYARMRRIDFGTSKWFALAAIPGAVLGVFLLDQLSLDGFKVLFALLLLCVGVWLLVRPKPPENASENLGRGTLREWVDRYGTRYRYRVPLGLGSAISAVIGVISSLAGVGGGIMQVPVMTQLFRIPVAVAVPTSQYTLLWVAMAAVIVHAFQGDLSGAWFFALVVALGAVCGAQVGAQINRRLRGTVIVRILAVALLLASLRLLSGQLL
jgi:uncharacterized membrane protein YfcA